MIPGTVTETVQVGLARLNNDVLAFAAAKARLKLAERRELVAAGKLPGSSALPFPVALAVDLVDQAEVDGTLRVALSAPVIVAMAIVDGSFTGPWFDAQGNAFLSFEYEDDATLFRLALDA